MARQNLQNMLNLTLMSLFTISTSKNMPLETPFPQYKDLETINLTWEGDVHKSNEIHKMAC